jgi:hypothetical protein
LRDYLSALIYLKQLAVEIRAEGAPEKVARRETAGDLNKRTAHWKMRRELSGRIFNARPFSFLSRCFTSGYLLFAAAAAEKEILSLLSSSLKYMNTYLLTAQITINSLSFEI